MLEFCPFPGTSNPTRTPARGLEPTFSTEAVKFTMPRGPRAMDTFWISSTPWGLSSMEGKPTNSAATTEVPLTKKSSVLFASRTV